MFFALRMGSTKTFPPHGLRVRFGVSEMGKRVVQEGGNVHQQDAMEGNLIESETKGSGDFGIQE